MTQCFEIFGLDFMLDDDLNVFLLEVNPGPDFQQTGDRLNGLIYQLWEQACAIVIDSDLLYPSKSLNTKCNSSDSSNHVNGNDDFSSASNISSSHISIDELYADRWAKAAKDFTLVYSKQWSTAGMIGGMSLTE